MVSFLLPLAAALAAVTTAVPLTGRVTAVSAAAAVGESYAWDVTNWSAGCARSGCYYDFNVTGEYFDPPNSTAIPAFLAYCSGYSAAFFAQCRILDGDDLSVAARLSPLNQSDPGAHIAVSLEFSPTEGTVFNYTGYNTSIFNQFVAPLQEFTVTPTDVWAIA